MSELHKACEKAHNPEESPDPEWRHSKYQLPPREALSGITQRSIDILFLSPGDVDTGGIGGIGWWQAANAYTAIALRDLWSCTRHNYSKLDSTLRACESRHAGFINEFNDDTLWWAMCCLYMYEIGGDQWYLDRAKGIWKYVRRRGVIRKRGEVTFRDMDMEGGCFWTTRPDEGQINAISTGLYAELSVRLALIESSAGKPPLDEDAGKLRSHVGVAFSQLKSIVRGKSSRHETEMDEDGYLEAARRSLAWILRCRYREEEAVVLDGLLIKDDHCNDWTFTYTTGVALGICALLYQALPNEEEYLSLACHIANKSMRRQDWVDEATGVISAEGEYGRGKQNPVENNDSVGFKSVLVRQLCTLYTTIRKTNAGARHPYARETAETIHACLKVNFESQMCRNTNGIGQYGPWWMGPFEMPTSHAQMAVLDVMASAELIAKH